MTGLYLKMSQFHFLGNNLTGIENSRWIQLSQHFENIISNPFSCFQEGVYYSHFPDGVTESRVRRSLAQGLRATERVRGKAENEFLLPTSQSIAT